MENARKQCPYCGEMIAASAKKCRFCGEWLEEEPEESVSAEHPDSNDITAAAPESNKPTQAKDQKKHEYVKQEREDRANGSKAGNVLKNLIFILKLLASALWKRLKPGLPFMLQLATVVIAGMNYLEENMNDTYYDADYIIKEKWPIWIVIIAIYLMAKRYPVAKKILLAVWFIFLVVLGVGTGLVCGYESIESGDMPVWIGYLVGIIVSLVCIYINLKVVDKYYREPE